jgi:hypothetical protein
MMEKTDINKFCATILFFMNYFRFSPTLSRGGIPFIPVQIGLETIYLFSPENIKTHRWPNNPQHGLHGLVKTCIFGYALSRVIHCIQSEILFWKPGRVYGMVSYGMQGLVL